MLSSMYVRPLSAFIDSYSIAHDSFSDDLQLEMSVPSDKLSRLLHFMQSCISDIKDWPTANMLKLNDKIELMLVTLRTNKNLHSLSTSIINRNAQNHFSLVRIWASYCEWPYLHHCTNILL